MSAESQPKRGGVLIVAAAAIVACGIATHTHRNVSTAAPFAAAGPPGVATAPSFIAPPMDAASASKYGEDASHLPIFDDDARPASLAVDFDFGAPGPLPRRPRKMSAADQKLGMRIADAIPPSLSRTENATAFWLTIEAHEGRVTLSGSVARDADRVRLAEIATRVPGAASVENRIEVGMPSSTYLDAEYSGESVADVMTAKEVIRALGKARVVAWNNIEIRPEFLRPFDRLLDPLYMIVERAAEAEAGAGTVATLAYGGLAVLVVESHQRFAWAVADGLGPMVGWHPEREEFPGSIFIGSDFLGPDFEHFAGAGFEGLHGDGVEVELMSVETIAAPPRPVIRVDVRDGVATLTGSAESDALRVRAGRVAAEVPGVLRVENRLQVQSQAEYEERLQREIMKHLRMDELPRAPRADAGIQPSGSRIGR